MKRACIIGATGFGGCGLLEILARHPEISVTQLFARNETNIKIGEVFPHLAQFYDLTVQPMDKIDYSSIDIAFFSTPDRAGMAIIRDFYDRGITVIDYSGDFRFSRENQYTTYAENKSIDTNHLAPDLLEKSVYGLCEFNRDKIAHAPVIGNPGCFAISLILPLLPLVKEKVISSETIICDSKSGVSGAGKNPGNANFYPQRYENMNTYREGSHQHLVEVEENINSFENSHQVFFVPQIIPMTRGILSNIYAEIAPSLNEKNIFEIYDHYYGKEPFVTITGNSPQTAFVRGTNNCFIRPKIDKRTGKLLVTSVIDNLMKGQSGNAVHCANIRLGLDETLGLNFTAQFP